MTADNLEQYILGHITDEPEWLKKAWHETWQHRLYPRMCTGPLQGSILTMLAGMIRPRRVLELGTYSGYSAMALADGMPRGAVLHTVEIDDEHEEFILRQIARSPRAADIRLHIGDAMAVVPEITTEPWDLVYIDANKRQYPDYYRMIMPLMAPGGYIIADNTLWDGKVADPDDTDPQCAAIKEFNNLLAADKRLSVAILPLRDGLTVAKVNETSDN